MDELTAFLRLAGALAGLVAGVLRVLKEASELKRRDKEEDR